MSRTSDELREFATKKTAENYCCCHEPLLNIPLDHNIPDELHLMLRVTDILLENLIEDALQWDDKFFVWEKQRPCRKSRHVKNRTKLINNCGVTFHFSMGEKNADGKGSGTWDWASVHGGWWPQEIPQRATSKVGHRHWLHPTRDNNCVTTVEGKDFYSLKKEQTIYL